MTKLAPKRVRSVRTRGGNTKYRALRLDHGNMAWASESISRKCRILNVVYNSCSNELVRTNTLVKNCIVEIDATPLRQWYESHYVEALGRKKGTEIEADDQLLRTRSQKAMAVIEKRRAAGRCDERLATQFTSGKVLACISSRPGQCGRADGYILEGKELEFYQRKIH